MPTLAMSLLGSLSGRANSATDIYRSGYGLKMERINAPSISAEVVNVESFWNFSDMYSV